MLHAPSPGVLGEKTIRAVIRQTPPPTAPAPGAIATNPSTTTAQATTIRFTTDLPPIREDQFALATSLFAARPGRN